jgi:hypothetical protein
MTPFNMISKVDKKTIIQLTSCFFGSILIVVFLQLNAIGPNMKRNHFIRIFPPHFLGPPKSIELRNPEYYIAGLTERFIYLGNYVDPRFVFETDWKLLNLTNYLLMFPNQKITSPSSLHLSIDSPLLYLNNYETGSVFKGLIDFPTRSLSEINLPDISSSVFLPGSSGNFAVRTFDMKLNENVLGKLLPDSPHFKIWPNLLEKQSEGVFSTDGLLRFNRNSGLYVYMYFYRNQFICMDNNFNLLYKGQTLDTNSYAKIRLVSIPYQNSTSFASPGFRVNRIGCINQDWIFINSDLKADNEENDVFPLYSVIDVYGMKNGSYHFSFYLPKGKGKISDMAILHNNLVVIQNNELTVFPLNIGASKFIPNP